MKKIVIIGGLMLVLQSISLAAIIHVPGDVGDIQTGIYAAVEGDTVLVADGTYTGTGNRDIDTAGKIITIMSESGAAACIIDCEGTPGDFHRAFICDNDESVLTSIQGFTLRNGHAGSENGGAVWCDSHVSFSNCIFENNIGSNGGAMYFNNSMSSVSDCIFQ